MALCYVVDIILSDYIHLSYLYIKESRIIAFFRL